MYKNFEECKQITTRKKRDIYSNAQLQWNNKVCYCMTCF